MQKYPATSALAQLDAADNTAARALVPLGPAIDRSPLSPANKAALKSTPIGTVLGWVDAPAQDLLNDIVTFAVAYSGVHQYTWLGQTALLDLSRSADEVYGADALGVVKKLRSVQAYMVLVVKNPKALGVGWIRALEKRGQTAVQKVTLALGFVAQMAQAGWNAPGVQAFTDGVREAAGSAFSQGVDAVHSAVDTGAQMVRDFVSQFHLGDFGITPAIIVAIIAAVGNVTCAAITAGSVITTALIAMLGKMHSESVALAAQTASAAELNSLVNKGILPPGYTQPPSGGASIIPGVPNLALAAGVGLVAYFAFGRK